MSNRDSGKSIESVLTITGILVWTPVWLPVLIVIHVMLVSVLYWRWFKMPFRTPYLIRPSFGRRAKVLLLYPHSWAHEERFAFRNPKTGLNYYLVGEQEMTIHDEDDDKCI